MRSCRWNIKSGFSHRLEGKRTFTDNLCIFWMFKVLLLNVGSVAHVTRSFVFEMSLSLSLFWYMHAWIRPSQQQIALTNNDRWSYQYSEAEYVCPFAQEISPHLSIILGASTDISDHPGSTSVCLNANLCVLCWTDFRSDILCWLSRALSLLGKSIFDSSKRLWGWEKKNIFTSIFLHTQDVEQHVAVEVGREKFFFVHCMRGGEIVQWTCCVCMHYVHCG